jgi:hypothetical protein
MTDGSSSLTIRIEGRVDICTAATVVERLRLAREDLEVVIDLAPSVQCDLVALSYIAEAIERRAAPVSVRGLSGHDMRILQYLGVELPDSPKKGPTD